MKEKKATAIRHTPLHDEHLRLGAKMVDFSGWHMPVQYAGILEEHAAVRNEAGVFDVSHMGEITIKGEDAILFCEHLVTNNIEKMKFGEICYAMMCNPEGGVIDDLLVYKIRDEEILLVVNAANTEKDFEWIKSQVKGFRISIQNESDRYAQIALQGPKSQSLLNVVSGVRLEDIDFYTFAIGRINGIETIISRTGYTGEDGFECYLHPDAAKPLWRKMIELGARPAGLGARDLLRFEASYMLYGHELDEHTSPLEAGLSWAVDIHTSFIGHQALKQQKETGLKKRLRGLKSLEKGGIPRQGNPVLVEQKKVGYVTSGNKSPSLGENIAMAYLPPSIKTGQEVEIAVRDQKTVRAVVMKLPFFRGSVRSKKKSSS